MSWPLQALRGPMIWALAFAGLYALHGAGCALGWAERPLLWGSRHDVVLQAGWALALLTAGGVLLRAPQGPGTGAQIARAGGWIGLVAVLLTLFPVLGLSSCTL